MCVCVNFLRDCISNIQVRDIYMCFVTKIPKCCLDYFLSAGKMYKYISLCKWIDIPMAEGHKFIILSESVII